MTDQGFSDRNSGLFQCSVISGHTLLCSKNPLRSTDDTDIAMASFYKLSYCILRSFFIVHQHTVTGDSLYLTVNQNDWFSCPLKFLQMISFFINRHIDNPVNPPADQELYCLPFQFLIGSAVTDDRGIAMASKDIFHTRYDFSAECIIQLRNHYTYCFGRIRLQPSGNFIDFIMEFLNGFFNLYSVFLSDITAIKIRRNRSQTKASPSGDVFHCCRHYVSLPSVSTDISVY